MNNPFYYAKIWRGQNRELLGEIIDIHQYQALLKSRFSLFSFTGRIATVCVVTDDKAIDRNAALEFATNFMKGSYVNISVDLKNLTTTKTAGSPPPYY